MGKGKVGYIPENVFNEINNIKTSYNIPKQSDAFKKMSNLSQLGREVEKMSGYLYFENKLKKRRK